MDELDIMRGFIAPNSFRNYRIDIGPKHDEVTITSTNPDEVNSLLEALTPVTVTVIYPLGFITTKDETKIVISNEEKDLAIEILNNSGLLPDLSPIKQPQEESPQGY